METIPAAADDSSSANPSSASVKSDDGSSRAEGGRVSPPPNCAICLGRCRNKSFTDSCLHQFCFKCLVTWSKVKTECPLCKQNFKSIIHNVKSNHQYEEYPVEQRRDDDIERLDSQDIVAATRATVTIPRNDTMAVQQFLMQYPISAIMRQGLSSSLGGSGVPPRPRRRSSPTSFRRTVYRHNLWARPLPDFTGRFRECTPEFYRYNDSQVHRLVPWLNRELHYLLNENAGHIAYVLARILELLPQYHIASVEFRDALQRYFRERTDHFQHELYVFASTPYDLTGYDRNVQYGSDTRLSTTVNEVPSGSESDNSVDSDIVMVSSSHPSEPRAGPSRASATAPAPTIMYPGLGAGYMSRVDDRVIPIETISHSDTDDSSSEVMVVGYIKPPHQRTPEVVDLLGSDSDVLVQETPTDPPPPPSSSSTAPAQPSAAAASHAPVNLVKLKLTRQRASAAPDSDSDESYTPPPPVPPAARGRRRKRSSATTSDTDRGSSPASTSSLWLSSSSRSSSSSSSFDSSWSSSSYSPRRRAPPAKRKRKTSSRTRNKSRKRPSRSPKREKRRRFEEKRSGAKGRSGAKRKSRSGKDIKSTRRPAAAERVPDDARPGPSTTPEPTPAPAPAQPAHLVPLASPSLDAASSSTKRKHSKSSRDSKRLRSVVMKAETSQGGRRRHPTRAPASDTDSDDIPLNLSCRTNAAGDAWTPPE